MQVPLRKTNINGRGIPPVPDDQTRFTGIGCNTNAIGSINSYPQHPHLMTTMTRTNGADGFTTTTKPGIFHMLLFPTILGPTYNKTNTTCMWNLLTYFFH